MKTGEVKIRADDNLLLHNKFKKNFPTIHVEPNMDRTRTQMSDKHRTGFERGRDADKGDAQSGAIQFD